MRLEYQLVVVAVVAVGLFAGVGGGIAPGASGPPGPATTTGETAIPMRTNGVTQAASFTISNFRGPAEARVGDRITVEATVRNAGDAEGSTTVEYRLGDRTLGSQSVTLAAGESRTVQLRVTVPDLDDGTYQQGIFLAGTDTGQTGSLVVTRPVAEFSVLSFSGPSEVRIGERVTVEARVKNTGDADGSSSFQYRIRGRTVDTESVSIDAGETRTVTFQGTVPDVATGTTDHGVFVGSSSTGLTSRVTVRPREAVFELSRFEAPSRAPAGDSVSVEVRVTNTGSVSGTKTLEYRIDDRVVAERRLSLDRDQTRTIELEGTVPDLRPGRYQQSVAVAGTSTSVRTSLTVDEPTFEITDLRAPSQAGVNDQITVEATVRNVGRRSISRRVEYRIRDRTVASRNVDLAAGDSTTVTFEVTVPSLPDGTYRQGVFVADSATGQSTSLRLTAGSARFGVTDVQAPSTAVVGDRITAEATVRNRGGAGGTTRVEYRIGDRVVDSESVQVNAEGRETVTFEATVPALANGTYRQSVTVPAGEGFSTSLAVTAPPRQRPVWLVASLDAPSTALVGDRITVDATVRNRGETAGSRRLEYRIGEQVVATRTVSVPAGGERSVSFTARVPDLDGGSYTHGVYVGDGRNGRTAQLDVTVGEPRFVIADLRAPPSAETGASITVRASVVNIGPAAGETEVQYRLDGQVVDSQTVSVDPGERANVRFQVTVPDVEGGTYSHGVFVGDTDRGQTSGIVVEAPTPEPTAGSGPGFTAVLALVAVIAGALLAARRQ